MLFEPDVHRDSRGFFLETYHERKYREAGLAAVFVQDNRSSSTRDTLRGLHAQWRKPQGKLVTCLLGEVLDVAVDARPGSPGFGRWEAVRLTGDNFWQLYIPPGFLHGFLVLSERAELSYKCTALYDASDEIGVIWNDSDLGIAWGCDQPILSARDAALPCFAARQEMWESYRGL